MQTAELRTQDAPPLAIPLSFFLTAPLAIALAGGLLLWGGVAVTTSRWLPITLCLTHLGTLGFLTMVMLGALYQVTAVVVGSPVPWLRLAHVVHALFALGVAALCWGFAQLGAASLASISLWLAIGSLGPAILLFLIPLSVALARAQSFNPTWFGICSAAACFFLAATAGLWIAHGFVGMGFPGPRELWSQVHLGVALLGWVGCLITAVSWQVVPMFYLAREVPVRIQWTVQSLAVMGAAAPLLLVYFSSFDAGGASSHGLGRAAALALAPAIVAVWGLHPAATLWSLQGRRRKRSDGSLLFWRAGLALGPVTALAAAAAWGLSSEAWDLAFGWLAIWGWAGMIVHGMLTRIVPFLVWLHRFAPLVGRVPVPSVKKLLPDRWTRIGFALHLGSLLLGTLAIATGWDLLSRSTGLALLATAGMMARSLIHVVRQRPASASELD